MLLQACLGLEIRAGESRICLHYPALPEKLQFIRVRNLKVGSGSVDLSFERYADSVSVNILRRSGKVEIMAQHRDQAVIEKSLAQANSFANPIHGSARVVLMKVKIIFKIGFAQMPDSDRCHNADLIGPYCGKGPVAQRSGDGIQNRSPRDRLLPHRRPCGNSPGQGRRSGLRKRPDKAASYRCLRVRACGNGRQSGQ